MNYKVIIKIKFRSVDDAEVLYKSLYPDFKYSDIKGVRVHIELSDHEITAEFSSKDFSRLRGAINSFFRLVKTISILIT